MFIVDCFHPIVPINGSINPYNVTTIGSKITFQCNAGFYPSIAKTSVCNNRSGKWDPAPELHMCTLIEGNHFSEQVS